MHMIPLTLRNELLKIQTLCNNIGLQAKIAAV